MMMRGSSEISLETLCHSVFLDTIKAFKRRPSKGEPAVCPPPSASGHRLHSRSRRNKSSLEANPRGTRRRRESVSPLTFRVTPRGKFRAGASTSTSRRPSIHLGGRDRAPGDRRPLDGGCDCSDNRCEVSSRPLESHSDGHGREARRPPLDTGRPPKEPPPDD